MKSQKKAKGLLQLKDLKVEETNFEKKEAIILSAGEISTNFVISGVEASHTKEWHAILLQNLNKDPVSLPLKDANKTGMIFKAKKNLAGKAATSSLGKSVINKILDDQLKKLIQSLKNIIAGTATEADPKDLANTLEKNTVKIIVKAYFLW